MSVARRTLSCTAALLAVTMTMACAGRTSGEPPDDEDAGFRDAGPRPESCDFVLPTQCPAPQPTYADVEPIFRERCQLCHSPGGGEWPLTTRGHIADWEQDVRDLVANCSMPPPDAGVPITSGERVAILEWLLCGLPE